MAKSYTEKEIRSMTIDQLKVLAYDLMAERENAEKNLMFVNSVILEKHQKTQNIKK